MKNFEDTPCLAILMRYTGQDKKKGRKEVATHIKGLWKNTKTRFSSKGSLE
jgi:hypothetical protein